MGILESLTLSEVSKREENSNRTLVLRRKMAGAIDHQIALATAQAKNEPYVVEVEKWVITDKVAGTKERRKVSKAVKPWWFVGANDKVMLELRFSNRRIDIAGKASIVVGTADKLVATLSTVKKAAMAGELDLVMKGATDGRKKGRKAGGRVAPASPPTTTTSDRSVSKIGK